MFWNSKKKDDQVLVIPDIHQNYHFLENIVSRENLSEFQRIVFLGDFYDAKQSKYRDLSALKRTFEVLKKMVHEHAGRVQILLGNHDILYYAFSHHQVHSMDKNALVEYYGMPDSEKLTLSRVMQVSSILDSVVHATEVHGYLLTHAGLNIRFWNDQQTLAGNVATLNETRFKFTDLSQQLLPVFQAGKARGGKQEKGGPFWLDWKLEFEDHLPVPQIVGHTAGSEVRRIGRSYCLDAVQTSYAIIQKNGDVITKSI